MRTNCIKARAETAFYVERLESRCLLAGMVGPLVQVNDVEIVGRNYDPVADLTYAHEVLSLTGVGQTVAVIDSGIAYDHYALGGGLGASYRVVGGWDFTENDADPYDDGPLGYHGTHIAGIVGSSDENVPGLAPDVDLVALRVFDDSGHGDFDWIESALAWVHDHQNSFEHPITTVNLSIGSGVNSEAIPNWSDLEDELEALADDGIFVAVAAGNGFRQYRVAGLNYPAASPFVVPVASVGDTGLLSEFSQRHERALAAPGELVNSTVPDYLYGFDGVTDDFASVSGTSMATPFVAGASVLVREAFSLAGQTDRTAADIYRHLYDTADVVADSVTDASYRRVNLRVALDSILDTPDRPLSNTPDVISLGAISEAILSSTTDEWFEFTARQSGVFVVDGPMLDTADDVSVFDASSRIDEIVANEVAGHFMRFLAVQQGHRYRIHVPASADEIRLNQIVTLDSGELDVRGDRSEKDLYVKIGPAFVVAARGDREQVSTGGRLQDRFRGPIRVEQTTRGLMVHVETEVSDVGAPVPTIDDVASDSTGEFRTIAHAAAIPAHSIHVGFSTEVPYLRDDSLLSALATDASFARPKSGDARGLPEMPSRLLDRCYSDVRHRLSEGAAEDDLRPMVDVEVLLVDRALVELSERLTSYDQ